MSTPAGAGGGHDFVRPFIMTGGRTRTTELDLRVETLVQAIPGRQISPTMASEKVKVIERCADQISIAEIAVALNLVVGVVRVLVADLVDSGHLEVFDFVDEPFDVDIDMLTRISDRIRSL